MNQNAPSRKPGRLQISLRVVVLVVTLCCVAAWIVPWGLRRIALDPFSPAGLARERVLRDPFTEPDVKRSTPHNPEFFADQASILDLNHADAATIKKLNQSTDVMYADVALEEVLDDISTKYDIAFDTQAIAGTDARVVLAMKGPSLQLLLETMLRDTNLRCDAKGSVMVIRAKTENPAQVTDSQGPSTSNENAKGDPSDGHTSDRKALDPFAK